MQKHYIIYNSPIGKLTLTASETAITGILLNEQVEKGLINEETPLLRKLKKELIEYFDGFRKDFDLPLKQKLTPFQKEVYEVLKDVPYGYTVTYGDIAFLLNKVKGARAVGNALSKNNILILVPCHRVLGKNSLGGFSSGVEAKKKLLEIERSVVSE